MRWSIYFCAAVIQFVLFSSFCTDADQDTKYATYDFDAYSLEHPKLTNSENLDKLLSSINNADTAQITFKKHQYTFEKTINNFVYQGKIKLIGKGNTKFILSNSLLNIQAKAIEISVENKIARHAKTLAIYNLDRDISLLRFSSNDTVEIAWNYTAGDLVRVSKTDGNSVTIYDSLNFSYEPLTSRLTGYKAAWMGFEGIHFQTVGKATQLLSFTGLGLFFKNCTFENSSDVIIPSMVNIYNSGDVKVEESKIKGEADYGFLINGSRNIYFKNIRSSTCMEPIAPATWTTNVNVENLVCKGSVIDSHPSFQVSYKNIRIKQGDNYWNCRALGVNLENCYFRVKNSNKGNSIYIGMETLRKKYEYLYDEFDVICKNVNWIHKDFGYNGLHVHRCRDFLLTNCVSHTISTGDRIRNFEIRDSKVGRVFCADSNFKIYNTNFSASLEGLSEIVPPLSCSYDGQAIIESCSFRGYHNTWLFKYIQSKNTEILFDKCKFGKMKGFVQKAYAPLDSYKSIVMKVENSSNRTRRMFSDIPKIQYLRIKP